MSQATNENRTCTLVFSSGEAGSVRDFILLKAQENRPLLAWAEPEVTAVDCGNDSGQRTDFRPLVTGVPDWPAGLPLVEARLFWEASALHVVANEDGSCRWVAISEGGGVAGGRDVTCREFDVHTIMDRRRFGLSGSTERLIAIEYWQHGRMIGWRLLTAGAGVHS